MIQLKNNYLILSDNIFSTVLERNENIYFCYQETSKKLLICPVSQSFFTKIHPNYESTFLKLKNKEGDRCFQISNLILDHFLEEKDRPLTYEIKDKTKILIIDLDTL